MMWKRGINMSPRLPLFPPKTKSDRLGKRKIPLLIFFSFKTFQAQISPGPRLTQ